MGMMKTLFQAIKDSARVDRLQRGDEQRVIVTIERRGWAGLLVEYCVGASYVGGPYIDLYPNGDFTLPPFDVINVWDAFRDRPTITYGTSDLAEEVVTWLAFTVVDHEGRTTDAAGALAAG